MFSQNLPPSCWCGGHTKVLGQESSAVKVGLAAGSGDPGGQPCTIWEGESSSHSEAQALPGALAASWAAADRMPPRPLGERQDPLHS